MAGIILNNISKPTSLTSSVDKNPLSFLEWKNRNIGIGFSDAEIQYQNYLRLFHNTIETNNVVAANKIKEDYLRLIERLQIIFQNDQEFERYTKIDLTSETDLSLVIPIYARKLKEIALFYTKKREEIKNKKLEYNLVGSYDGLIKLLYSNLVSKFTKTEQTQFVHENPLITQSPEFSAISSDFEIDVEELYDTTDYFQNQESINPFACAFNDLCFSLITTDLSAKADPLEANYICNPSNETVDFLLQNAYQKYTSTNVNYISGGYYIEKFQNVQIPLETGNNFFYWFEGRTVFDIPEGIYKPISIQDISWTNATGGSSLDISDLVFVNAGNNLTKGAWLQDTQYVTVTANMDATIVDGKIFKFPYPDYGVSAIGGSWSGPGLDDTIPKSKKFFPTEEDFTNSENSINRLYWNSFSALSAVEDIYLQETTLGALGRSSNKFVNADKVYVGTDNGQTAFYSDTQQAAWLYDFRQTQIPITAGENKIYFPLQRYEESSELFFNFDKGQAIALSSIKVQEAFSGAIAGLTLDSADTIVRNRTVCGPELEMAWLKSTPLRYYSPLDNSDCNCEPDLKSYYTDWKYISGGTQVGLSFKCNPDNYVRFTWTGETTDINNVQGFTGFAHDDSCEYKRADHSSSIVDINFLNAKNRDIFEKWKKCTCQAVQYSPFGHKQSNFENYDITPDFIVKDSKYPKLFNKKTWIGTDGKNYLASKDLARFYPELIEKDVGWGKGFWKTQTDSSFVLEKGQSYIYYRTDTNNCSFESPYFVINSPYDNTLVSDENCNKVYSRPKWMKAIKDENGTWIDAGVESDMILKFGDFLTYNHQDSFSEIRRRLLYNNQEITSLSGDYVTLPLTDSNVAFTSHTNTVPAINFLIKIPVNSYTALWGKADYGADVNTDRKMNIDSTDFRNVYDYLQITQPIASDIVLHDKDVVEYKFGVCDSSCFVWNQPLSFSVYAPIRKWNKIEMDTCIESDILSYLNKEMTNCYLKEVKCLSECEQTCGCEHFCHPTKTGVFATHEDSDVIFNTELSGIPLFVNYFSRNSFVQDVRVQDITDGEKSLFVPVVSSNYNDPENPWRNLLNQNGANFVIEENISNLKTKTELNFYQPKKIGMGRYETFDSRSTIFNTTSGNSLYRTDNYFDNPLKKSTNDSSYVTEYSLGKRQGLPKTDRKQTFTPYTNAHEKCGKEYYGLYKSPLSFTPWNSDDGTWKESDLYKNFRGQYNVNCNSNWYTDQLTLTGDVWNWQTDIYGNQFFTIFNETIDYTSVPNTYGQIFIKMPNGKVHPISDALSSVTTTYANISANLYDSFAGI